MMNWVEVWRGRGSVANWLHHELLKRNIHHQVRPLLAASVDPSERNDFAIYVPNEDAETVREVVRRVVGRRLVEGTR